jgi:hypothetical protein
MGCDTGDHILGQAESTRIDLFPWLKRVVKQTRIVVDSAIHTARQV